MQKFSSSSFRSSEETATRPIDPKCEYGVNPIGLDVSKPRFSCVLSHPKRGQYQTAYQIMVSSSVESLKSDIGDVWDSGKVSSNRSAHVVYEGIPLESGQTCYWKVRWWDKDDQVSPWSDVSSFEMGLLRAADWKAKWIHGGQLLRKEFIVEKEVAKARAYVSGLGYYELRINGHKVGDKVLDPGWTDYDKVVLYSTYDVTEFLREGRNVVRVILGNGRYVQEFPSGLPPNLLQFIKKYENAVPKVILQIELKHSDGSQERIISDDTWKVSEGPIIKNDIYNGETYEARLEKEGWDTPAYDDSGWKNANMAEPPSGKMVSQATFPPIRAVRTIQPISISNPKPGVYVYDFGQNFTGWVRLTVSGPPGSEVKLRHTELLHPDGMINPIPNRGAKATDTYILKGKGVEVYEPRFTCHGFRYVEVTGFPGTPSLDTIQGVVVHSAVEPVGGFACSNPLINSIHRNVIWGQLSNLMSIPTDCPQRDERMGWMGDAQLTVEEAIYNFDMAGFYTKWMRDIKEAQEKDGSVPDVVPPYWRSYPADPAWGTACVTIPWHLYLYYGDKRILEEYYQVMRDWVDFLGTKAEGYIVKYSKYGDWCPPAYIRSPDTPGELVSTWCYYQDAVTLSKIAHTLGKSTEAEKYAELSEKIKEAFNKEFLKNDRYAPLGQVGPMPPVGSQTSNLLPLYSDMVPEDKREAVARRLLEDIEVTHDCHVGTGIVGTRCLLDTLSKYDRADIAYKLVTQTTYPSWGYMIREGATTLWERWEYLAGSGMNSHNHIMFGSIDAWFYKVLAGINVDSSAPGFERFVTKPYIAGDLRYASASIRTIRGIVSSEWTRSQGFLTLRVTVPVNTKGEVYVPKIGLKNVVVRESGEVVWRNSEYLAKAEGITEGSEDKEHVIFDVGSGSYVFELAGE